MLWYLPLDDLWHFCGAVVQPPEHLLLQPDMFHHNVPGAKLVVWDCVTQDKPPNCDVHCLFQVEMCRTFVS